VFRFLSALVVTCLLAQAAVTVRGTGNGGGCDPTASAGSDQGPGDRDDGARLRPGCCCGSGAPCPADCDECACCPHQRPMTLPATTVTPILDHLAMEYGRLVYPVERPRADEILHVPKAATFV